MYNYSQLSKHNLQAKKTTEKKQTHFTGNPDCHSQSFRPYFCNLYKYDSCKTTIASAFSTSDRERKYS